MKYAIITAAIVFIFGTLLLKLDLLDSGNVDGRRLADSSNETKVWSLSEFGSENNKSDAGSLILRAPGKIEGKTDAIELRSQVIEKIVAIHVTQGRHVSKGDVLVSLDTENLLNQRELSAAMLKLAMAKKSRLEKGARASEIEAAKQEHAARLSPLWSADRALTRGLKLLQDKAISAQALDELKANVDSHRALAAAAKARLVTLQQPAHPDDLSVANAEVSAARSRLNIAQINLERSQLKAPSDGQILEINANIGEVTDPESVEPLIVMVDITHLHAVAEIDDFDALKVKLGQFCEITSDAHNGVLASGRIVEIEPQMYPKQLFGQWAGERNDTFSRRVRILMSVTDGLVELPIGLPVDVAILVKKR